MKDTVLRIHCPNCKKKLAISNPDLLGKQVKCPSCKKPFRIPMTHIVKPSPGEAEPPVPTEENKSASQSNATEIIEGESLPANDPLDQLSGIDTDFLANRHLQKHLSKKKSGSKTLWGVLGVILILLAAGGYYFWSTSAKSPSPKQPVTEKPEKNVPPATPDQNSEKPPQQKQASPPVDQEEPISQPNDPIVLKNLPDGIRLLIHLRPKEILELPEEKKNSFLPVLNWGTEQFQLATGISPELAETVLIGMIPRTDDQFPHIVFQIFLSKDLTNEEIAKSFSVDSLGDLTGKEVGEKGFKVFRYDSVSRSVGLFSQDIYNEIKTGLSLSGTVSIGMESLLEESNQKSDLTIIWDLISLRNLISQLQSEELKKFLELVSDWHGEETLAGMWQFSYENDLFIKSAFRNNLSVSEKEYQRKHEEKLNALVKTVTREIPKDKSTNEGVTRILERFPTMIQFAVMKTNLHSDSRLVVSETILPGIALENLMVGSLLSWNHLGQVSGPIETIQPNKEKPQVKKSLVELMSENLNLEFNRTPLRNAFEEMAESLGVKLTINGNAIKELGYTQNMPQTKNFENIPAKKAFEEILNQYEGMVLVLDEGDRTLLITTSLEAEKNQQKIFAGTPKK